MKRFLFLNIWLYFICILPLKSQNIADIKHFSWQGLTLKERKVVEKSWQKAKIMNEIEQPNAKWKAHFLKQGYSEVYLDSAFVKKDSAFARIWKGQRYYLRSLQLAQLPTSYLNDMQSIKQKKGYLPLYWNGLEGELQNIILAYQNQGFPFARFYDLRVDYQQKKDSILTDVSYQFETGKAFKIDSIVLEGSKQENQRLLYAMLRIRPNDLYNQQNINNIPRILNASIYYQNVKPADVIYKPDGKASIHVAVQKRKTSQADGLIGILPPTNPTLDRRFQFTVMLNLSLISMFKQGESLQLKYEKLPNTASRGSGKFSYPYIAGTPLHASVEGNFFQQAIEFTNLQGKAEVKYQISPFLSANVSYQYKQTTLNDSLVKLVYVYKTRTTLTALSSKSNLYATGLVYEKLNDKLVPTKGISLQFETMLGSKNILKNPSLVALKPTFYDSIPLKQNVVLFNLQVKAYYLLQKRSILHIAHQSYWLNQSQILASDQMRLGGAKSIRGFNESQFFADKYATFTAEYRFLLDRKSYLQAFVDYGYLRDSFLHQTEKPIGIGLGMTYDVPVGILSISYAVGKSNNQAFQFGRGRIHLGIMNEF